jgi:hypothetical protein
MGASTEAGTFRIHRKVAIKGVLTLRSPRRPTSMQPVPGAAKRRPQAASGPKHIDG